MIGTYGLPDILGSDHFLPEQPRCRISIDAGVSEYIFRSYAMFQQLFNMACVDLKWPHVPRSITVTQRLSWPASLGR